MVTQETQTPEPVNHELEPTSQYDIGDTVTLNHSLNPDTKYLITTAIMDTPDGLMTGGIPVDDAGNGVGMDGSFLVEDIKRTVGPRKSVDEVTRIYIDMMAVKFGNTIPTEQVVGILKRQMKLDEREKDQ
jgi:hypothetical protein